MDKRGVWRRHMNIFPSCLAFYRHNEWSINHEILNENNLKEGLEEDIKHYTY